MNKTILIVDDSLTVRMDLVEAFEEAGFRCLPCSTAAEARGALVETHIDLAVLDVLLPDGDGVDLLREIRGTPAQPKCRCLRCRRRLRLATGSGTQTGADEYVGKP
jgi:DNA-binding response OmpR family regulator